MDDNHYLLADLVVFESGCLQTTNQLAINFTERNQVKQ